LCPGRPGHWHSVMTSQASHYCEPVPEWLDALFRCLL
jgi:hypothetical protein